MKILMIPSFFQEKRRPTLGSFFLEQAIALQKEGHEVIMCYCDTYSVKYVQDWIHYEETKMTIKNGVKIYRIGCFCPLKHGMKGHKEAFYRGILKIYDADLCQEGFDIIHAHCAIWAGYAAMKLSKKTGIPYVVTEHSSALGIHVEMLGKRISQSIQEVYDGAKQVICVSSYMKKLMNTYREGALVIGNVVNCDFFQPEEYTRQEGFSFFAVCHMYLAEDMIRSKGIEVLLRAWRNISKEYPNAHLTIGGNGDAFSLVQGWVEEWGLQDSVSLPGALTREETADHMKRCDCFVLPSRFETFGVVYIEAMACGKPVIAVSGTGPDDIVTEKTGILLSSQSEEELSQGMRKMIQGIDSFDATEIRQSALGRYSEKVIAKQLLEVYQAG